MKLFNTLLISAALLFSIDTHAEIGKIGSSLDGCSPTIACGAPHATKLLGPYFVGEVSFDGNEGYYEQQLAQLVVEHEHSYRNSVYEIVSILPDVATVDPSYVATLNQKWEANLTQIVQTLKSTHVPQSRIFGRKEASPEASINTIRVLVYLSVSAD